MRYLLNGPFKEYRNKKRTDNMRTKLTETTLITQIRQGVIERIFPLKQLS